MNLVWGGAHINQGPYCGGVGGGSGVGAGSGGGGGGGGCGDAGTSLQIIHHGLKQSAYQFEWHRGVQKRTFFFYFMQDELESHRRSFQRLV